MSTKTVNRQPFSVNTPSSSDIKDYFFNHYNWKGMKVDENFLAVDQETFEDCNNVYVNSDGLLRSRPSMKPTNKPQRDYDYSIVDFWIFDDYIVYKTEPVYRLLICNKKNVVLTEILLGSSEVFLKRIESLLFIFKRAEMEVYDLETESLRRVEDVLYVPETKIFTGVISTDNESKNLLTPQEIYTYLYSNDLEIPVQIIGKNVYVDLYGKRYEFLFQQNSEKLLVATQTQVDLSRFNTTSLSNLHIIGYPRNGYDSWLIYSKTNRSLIYSSDGINISREVKFNHEIVLLPEFTRDGNHIVYSEDRERLYILSVEKTEYNGSLNYKYSGNDLYGILPSFPIVGDTDYLINAFYFITDNTGVLVIHYADNLYLDYWIDGVHYGCPISQSLSGLNKIMMSHDSTNLWFALLGSQSAIVAKRSSNTAQPEIFTHTSSALFKEVDLRANANKIVIAYSYVSYSMSTYFVKYVYTIFDIGNEKWTSVEFYEENKGGIYPSENNGIHIASNINIVAIAYGLYHNYYDVFLEYPDGKRYVIFYDNYLHFVKENTGNFLQIYTNSIEDPVKIQTVIGTYSYQHIFNNLSQSQELSEHFLSSGNTLYITSKRIEDEQYKLYLPNYNVQKFSSNITGLQSISSTVMAIFTEDGIWYSTVSDGVYSYYKSKLQVGLKQGADVITSYDGTNVIFPTERGLVSLAYQNFVASTDQVLTYLSDNIFDKFKNFVKKPVKLLRYQYWLICYVANSWEAYVYDIRNNSWWPITSNIFPIKLLMINNEVTILTDKGLHILDKSDYNYYDYDGTNEFPIKWNLKSQKLHLNAINYCKHISNLTLYSVLDSDVKTSFKMAVNNYRKKMNEADIQTIEYDVDIIRTYVKRVNYPKVNEFQYELRYNDEQAVKVPLSLTGITIKYNVSGQVR